VVAERQAPAGLGRSGKRGRRHLHVPGSTVVPSEVGKGSPIQHVLYVIMENRTYDQVFESKVWPTTAIFFIEDDAQNGPDHVDSHRTIGLVVSPYVKRSFVDSTMYSTVSMLRTMELLLGLPPLTQHDAAATVLRSPRRWTSATTTASTSRR
jgi:hypothetical protein